MIYTLESLTTSFTVDILNIQKAKAQNRIRIRKLVHILISLILVIVILIFGAITERTVIDAIFTVAGYTYGPLLGLYSFGLLTKYSLKDKLVPFITIISPIICVVINHFSEIWFNGYEFGFEILILNGLITFIGLFLIRKRLLPSMPSLSLPLSVRG